MLPFAAHTAVSKKKASSSQDVLYGDEDENAESDVEEDDDIEKDALIKVFKFIVKRGSSGLNVVSTL